ncbi:MAG TPA: winged helix-turn-helix domain-containing protein [Nitrosopumilaceae archaeon]|nr:winged helix-turn-helix domain-containing protein [Nitrosopumilaceae archaeon]
MSTSKTQTESTKNIKMLFWSVFAGSKGCLNRVKIVLQLKQTPLNTNKLSVQLGLDYKVVERHLEILEKQNLVERVGYNYGSVYILTTILESNFNLFNEVSGKSKNCNENFQMQSS